MKLQKSLESTQHYTVDISVSSEHISTCRISTDTEDTSIPEFNMHIFNLSQKQDIQSLKNKQTKK